MMAVSTFIPFNSVWGFSETVPDPRGRLRRHRTSQIEQTESSLTDAIVLLKHPDPGLVSRG